MGMSVLDPDSGISSSKPEVIMPSDNNLASASNVHINHPSTENGSNDKIPLPEMDVKASSTKRKHSKSKRGSEKKVKLASHEEDGSAISVRA